MYIHVWDSVCVSVWTHLSLLMFSLCLVHCTLSLSLTLSLSSPLAPYIKVYLVHHGKRQHKWRSSIKHNTLMPIFNEAFRFDVSTMDLKNVSLELLLMDHNRFSGDEVLGIVRVGEHCPEETGQSHWNELFLTQDHAVSRWHSVWPITHIYDGSSDRESIN